MFTVTPQVLPCRTIEREARLERRHPERQDAAHAHPQQLPKQKRPDVSEPQRQDNDCACFNDTSDEIHGDTKAQVQTFCHECHRRTLQSLQHGQPGMDPQQGCQLRHLHGLTDHIGRCPEAGGHGNSPHNRDGPGDRQILTVNLGLGDQRRLHTQLTDRHEGQDDGRGCRHDTEICRAQESSHHHELNSCDHLIQDKSSPSPSTGLENPMAETERSRPCQALLQLRVRYRHLALCHHAVRCAAA